MSEQTPEGVVPYVDYHTGAKRVLTINTLGNPKLSASATPPIVSIDGRQYIVYWGTVSFEIPADRPCHVSVHLEGERIAQATSQLLPPGGPLTLTYEPQIMSGLAELR